jgi:hypothetical protein
MSLIDVALEGGDRGAVDPGDRLHLDGRSRGQRAAEDADAPGLPDLARRRQRLCLAGAGGRADDLDACAGGRVACSHRGLLAAEPRALFERRGGLSWLDARDVAVAPIDGVSDEPLLEREHVRRRVPRATEVTGLVVFPPPTLPMDST